MIFRIEKLLASAALFIAILSEINHSFIQQVPWTGFSEFANNVSFVLIPVWVLAFAGLWTQDRLYKFFQVAGICMMCIHALVLSIGGNRQSVLLYLSLFLISAVSSFLLENAAPKSRLQL